MEQSISTGVLYMGLVTGGLIFVIFVLSGFKFMPDDRVGIPTRRMFGKKMPPGRVIAKKDEIGVQARKLMPGLYWFFPIIWKVERVPVTVIGPQQIGVLEAIDGEPIPTGRLLGDETECDSYQDAEAFLFGRDPSKPSEPKGKKGPQIGILRPGTYRVNTRVFKVQNRPATQIKEEHIGVIVAADGRPLLPGYIVAPRPEEEEPGKASVQGSQAWMAHSFFQDGQAFIDNGGYRGPQLDTLQPGQYYINPLLFEVKDFPIVEIPPGYVAVLRSNIGQELVRDKTLPQGMPGSPDLQQQIHEREEVVLNAEKLERGIWREPVAPGKYNLNPLAFSAFLVPTSAVTIDWAAGVEIRTERHERAPGRAPAQPPSEEIESKKATEFFKFSQLTVTSKDGFRLEVDVRLIIRIRPQHAAFIIARFGSVANLIEQIVHPLIDSSFRNNAGEKKAIDFIQQRTALQKDALEKAREEFDKYHVEAQNLLIAYISVDQSLLDTQTLKEIAIQQQEQYQQQANAQEERIEVEEKTARANKQKDVIDAKLSIDINTDMAQAAIEKAKGDRDATKIRAEGDAQREIQVGQGIASAYEAQARVVGPERLALIRVMEHVAQGKIRITPDFLVMGGSEQQGGTLWNAWLATMLAQQGKAMTGSGSSTSTASGKGPE
jgi:uncharacterized membrane protein YqiK